MDSAQIVIFVFTTKSRITLAKVHIFSDSRYGQLIKCLNKDKIVEMSRNIVDRVAKPSRYRFGSR